MGAPMPDTIRHSLRAVQHPARAVECPHCGAHPHRPCTSPSKRRLMPQPHPARVSAWVTTVAVCPACEVPPGTPCHIGGRAIPSPHPQRETEATETAA